MSEGKTQKRHQVVMLPTGKKNDKEGICFDPKNNKTYTYKHGDHWGMAQQHLYILSDDEIKEGDWVVKDGHNRLYQIEKESNRNDCKKVVATTDSKIQIGDRVVDDIVRSEYLAIAKIPQDFIQAYIREYNAGNKIEGVMLEMELWYMGHPAKNPSAISTYVEAYGFRNTSAYEIKLKLRSDGTVIIHPTKERVYTLEEAIEIFVAGFHCDQKGELLDDAARKHILENYS